MKKILMLVIASSLVGASAMAVGPNKEINCKDVVKKVKEMQDKKAAANGQADESAPAAKGNSKDAN
ncbi:MAG: hypothetical protein AB7K68_16930 [Bacteriovoracia bacterium]